MRCLPGGQSTFRGDPCGRCGVRGGDDSLEIGGSYLTNRQSFVDRGSDKLCKAYGTQSIEERPLKVRLRLALAQPLF